MTAAAVENDANKNVPNDKNVEKKTDKPVNDTQLHFQCVSNNSMVIFDNNDNKLIHIE